MKSTATFSLAALLALPAMSCAQDPRALTGQHRQRSRQTAERPRTSAPHRTSEAGPGSSHLESVTWDSVKHELTWTISGSQKKEGASTRPDRPGSYLIKMDEATMSVGAETRRFSREEAANVHILLDLLAKYAVDSTLWWDDGQGEPLDGNGIERKAPERRRAPVLEADGSVLHVSNRGSAVCPGIQGEIRALEQRLERLRELERSMNGGKIQLTGYAPEKY